LGLLALVSVSTLLLVFDVGARVLASNDEARFPLLARDVLRHGTWLLPWLGDAPYLNKPPLDAALIGLASWPTGAVTQTTAAWPSLLAALGIVLATWWIGARLWSGTVGLMAGFIVLTTHGVFSMARVPMPDIVLCLALTAALAAFVAADFGGRSRLTLACYLLLGLGFLVKGPVALLGLAVIVVYLAWKGDRPGLGRLRALRGALVIAPVIAPWWIVALASRGPKAVQDNVVIDWLQWYRPFAHVTARGAVEPFGEALAILFPWSLLLPFVALTALRRRARVPAGGLAFVLVWAAVCFAIVALSEQQRMRYYLPLCPPVALLLAVWLQRVAVLRRAAIALTAAAAVAAGLVAWQAMDTARYNALTDISALRAGAVAADRPLYAVEVPALVLAFYLDRPVVSIPSLAGRVALAPGDFAVDDRTLAQWPRECPAERVAGGAVNGRTFSLLRLAPPGCPGTSGGRPSAG
jgi:4-amino-4-deoxy-L-arabinose transferase-like glycosyltransferase